MACGRESKLQEYVDGELSSVAKADMEAHVRTCVSCAASALAELQQKQLIHAAGKRYSATPEVRNRILGRIASKQGVAVQSVLGQGALGQGALGQGALGTIIPKWKRAPLWRWPLLPRFATAGAVLLIVIFLLGVYVRSQQLQVYKELADIHVTSLASVNPVDVVSSDRHTVKPWFQGKVPFSFNLPELQGSSYRLLGGRLIYLHQNPAADLLFEYQRHRLSVFIFQSGDAVLLDKMRISSGISFNADVWSRNGLTYVIISDASADVLKDLRNLLLNAS